MRRLQAERTVDDPGMGRPMINTLARSPQHASRLYSLAIPAAALCAFGIMALLWAAGLQSIGFIALRILGVEPGPVPFLDTHAVLAAAECQRRGVDVYLSNPCDVFGRPHVYSPLWLALVPPMLGTTATPWVGTALDLLFILALPLLIRGYSKAEIGIVAIAAFSPMTLYALERGNIDLVIFLLVLCAGLLQAGSRRWRLCSYAVLVGAALLKYYPAVLLALVARESRRDALFVLTGAVAALALFVAAYHDVLGQALSNTARLSAALSYYTDSFSARNLPFGLAQGLPQLHAAAAPFAVALFALLSAVALARMWRTALLLDAAGIDWTASEMRFAAIGSLLVTGCFFAAQNVNYRGVFLLFVLPGLVQQRGATASAAARQLLSRLIAAVLFVMWDEFFRRALLAVTGGRPSDRLPMLFWLLRELVWWWLIAGLAAIALCYVARLPLLRDGAVWLGRVCPACGRKLMPLFRVDPSADG